MTSPASSASPAWRWKPVDYIVAAYADGRGGIGARVIEMASRVRLAFAAACPDASLIRHIATALMPGP
jgi:hypothetical protein